MANYLFLLGMFYPRSSANGVCCKNIVDELIKQGHQVTCVVNGDVTRECEEYIDGAHIYRIKPRLYYRIQEWCHYHPQSKFRSLVSQMAGIMNKIQLFVMSPFWPCISPLYTNRFYQKAKELCKKDDYSAVIGVYTPVDTLYAGYLLKKEFPSLRFIPYYLDALAGGWGPTAWSKAKIDKRTRKLESKIDEVADLVISMQSAEVYHTAHPLANTDQIRRTYLDVPTFVDDKDSGAKQKVRTTANEPIKVLYSGSIHFPDRDPRPLLTHFANICKNSNVELAFMGSNNCPALFKEYAEATDGKIKVIGQYPHKEAMRKLRDADVLVNIGSSNPNTVTCKIFEYMQFRKPIISTYSIDNEPSMPYLEKYGCCFLLDERPDRNFEMLNKKLLSFLMERKSVEDNDYSQLFYANTPQAFIDTISNKNA